MTDTTHDIDALPTIWANTTIWASGERLAGEWNYLDVGSSDDTEYVRADLFTALQSERDAWKARAEAAEEALTPSGDTKAKYMGEFHFSQTIIGDDGDDVTVKTYVPWTTVKEIMSAIRARANKANALPDEIRALTPPADLAKGVADE